MAEDIFRQNSYMKVYFTAEIFNEALVMVGNLCLEITNKVFNQLGMPSSNRSTAISFDIKLRREKNYNLNDILSYVP